MKDKQIYWVLIAIAVAVVAYYYFMVYRKKTTVVATKDTTNPNPSTGANASVLNVPSTGGVKSLPTSNMTFNASDPNNAPIVIGNGVLQVPTATGTTVVPFPTLNTN
jgi:hypothetical protein